MIAFERRSARAFAGMPGRRAARPGAVLVMAGALIGAIAAADYATGFEIRLAILYLVPIALVTWSVGWGAGAGAALGASLCWLLSFEASHPYSDAFYFYWEGGITLASFLVFIGLLARLRASVERELVARHRDAVNRTARLVALGEFASAIAHELSQPLAAIATYNDASLRLLDQGAPDPEALRAAMAKTREQAKRAGAIIQRLREFLRQPAPALVEQDLNEVARAALQLAQADARETGVSIELDQDERVPRVRADRLLIEQVTLNLLRNAIEAVQGLAPERRRVKLATATGAKGQAPLSVSDLGDGVPPEARAELFNAFFTTKPGGLGLGLSICRSVIEVHGGTIAYEPNGRYAPDGRGARFTFSLPDGRA